MGRTAAACRRVRGSPRWSFGATSARSTAATTAVRIRHFVPTPQTHRHGLACTPKKQFVSFFFSAFQLFSFVPSTQKAHTHINTRRTLHAPSCPAALPTVKRYVARTPDPLWPAPEPTAAVAAHPAASKKPRSKQTASERHTSGAPRAPGGGGKAGRGKAVSGGH